MKKWNDNFQSHSRNTLTEEWVLMQQSFSYKSLLSHGHKRQHGVTINTIIHLNYWLVELSPSSQNRGLGVPVIARLSKRVVSLNSLIRGTIWWQIGLLARREVRLNIPPFSKGRFANSTYVANSNKLLLWTSLWPPTPLTTTTTLFDCKAAKEQMLDIIVY